jgi:pilus assembly protein CpaB
MRSKSILLIVLAVGCGLVATIGINQLMNDRNQAADQGERQAVFVAMTDISANEELTPQNMKMEEWPKAIVPTGSLSKLEEVEGKRCRMKLFAGEPILSSKLLGATEAVGAAKDIPPGYRVTHVKVDTMTGASNLILPGDRVDVVVFRQPNADMHVLAAKIVLQDIKVFAVDTHTETEFAQNKNDQTEPMSAKTIALLVTPQQAVILHAASEMGGALRLVLRNPDDNAHVVSQGATIGDLFGHELLGDREGEQPGEPQNNLTAWLNNGKSKTAPPVPSAPVIPAKKMTVMMGAQVVQYEIPGPGGVPVSSSGGSSGTPGLSGINLPKSIDSMPLPPAEEEQPIEQTSEVKTND